MNFADELAAEIRRKVPLERIARIIDQLPLAEREKLKRTFEPQPMKRIIRVKTRRK